MGSNWLSLASFLIIGLLVGGVFTYAAIPRVVEKLKEVPVEKPVYVDKIVGNITEITGDVKDIKAIVSEDRDWESDAFILATSEYEDKDYKAIFNAINDIPGLSIFDREDISSVTVTDKEVISSDASEKDAKVTQELKVRYEDADGDSKKVYLLATTTIKDGEVDKQKIVEA